MVKITTEKEALAAVKQDSSLLWHVPEKLRTIELYLEAIKGSGWVFKELMKKSLDSRKIVDIINHLASKRQVRPFEFIRHMDASRLLELVRQEEPHTIALMMTYLEPYKVSYLLQNLSGRTQIDVACRIATMERPGPEVLREIEQALEKKRSALPGDDTRDESTSTANMETIVTLFDLASRVTEERIIKALEDEDPELAAELKKRRFAFQDVALLSCRDIHKLMQEVDSQEFLKALKGMDIPVQDAIFNKMPNHTAAILKEDREDMGPVRVKDVEEARQKIILTVHRLEDAGEIVIDRMQNMFYRSRRIIPFNRAGQETSGNGMLSEDDTTFDGVETIIEIFDHADLALEKRIIEGMEAENPWLAEKIQKRMFTFRDIVLLSNRDMQKTLKEVDYGVLAKALAGEDVMAQDKIFKNLSKNAVHILKEEMEEPIRPRDVEKAQEKILLILRRMKYAGEIVIVHVGDNKMVK